MAELTGKQRSALPRTAFAIPEDRKYPIHNERHAANAISRVGAFGTPEEKARVYTAVARRYPALAKRSETIKRWKKARRQR
jgi:hypothetical protein